jgi:hypothetical protein
MSANKPAVTQEGFANTVAADLFKQADAGKVQAPNSRTHAVAMAAANDYDRYAGKLDHLANNTLAGDVTEFATALNQNAAFDGDEWIGNAMDSQAVIDKLAQAVIDRRNGK